MKPRDTKYPVEQMERIIQRRQRYALETESEILNQEWVPGREDYYYSGAGRNFLRLAKHKYLVGYPLDEIREDVRKSCIYYGGMYEYDKNDRYLKRASVYDYETYTEYLSLISLVYLLDIPKEDVVEYGKLLHIIKGRDILIDTILNAIVGTPIETTEKMATNPYKKLVEVILEEDKEKAQALIEIFMKKEWFKNSSKFMWRDLDLREDDPGVYEGYYAYETMAIARIKGLDLSRLVELEYFPADLVYYRDGKVIEVAAPEVLPEIEKTIQVPTLSGEIREFTFTTRVETSEPLDFRGAVFKGVDFSHLDLTGANFAGVNLEQCLFDNAKLVNVNFNGADMYGATFRNATLVACDFKEVTADGIWVSQSTIKNCHFDEGEFHGADFTESVIEQSRFVGSQLYETGFDRSQVTASDFTNSGYGGVSIEGAKFVACQFIGADISLTDFTIATLENTDITVGIVLDQDE